jgi:hypothetical protein
MQCSKLRLFDHLVGASEQRVRHVEAERFGRLEVDHQLVLGRRLHRKVGRLLALENAIDVAGRAGAISTRIGHAVLLQTLLDLGISKKQSSDWQKLAEIPQRDFERALKESERPTTAGIIREYAEPIISRADPGRRSPGPLRWRR